MARAAIAAVKSASTCDRCAKLEIVAEEHRASALSWANAAAGKDAVIDAQDRRIEELHERSENFRRKWYAARKELISPPPPTDGGEE